MKIYRHGVCSLALFCLAFAGCGEEKLSEGVKGTSVKGKLTLKGKVAILPGSEAPGVESTLRVSLVPLSSDLPSLSGEYGSDGSFTIGGGEDGVGVPAGKYKITLEDPNAMPSEDGSSAYPSQEVEIKAGTPGEFQDLGPIDLK